ncbi:MAG: hypothetical protein ACMX3H_14200 [Sodalis sp. (in: enterobacteria)]|uniref:hypothetical protein n=1 Tax=Sodalis sp. (in: enterobacteria) TaxID=1898979 RepID=UPI0039E39E60
MSPEISVHSYSDMLRTEQGRLMVFMREDDHQIRHWMVSLGNGRFAGMNNMKIAAHFGEEKRVLLMEQLGEFRNNLLYPRGAKYGFHIVKHTLGETPPARSLLQVAKELLHRSTPPQTPCEYALNILVHANWLSPQQSAAVQETLAHLVNPSNCGLLSQHKLEDVLLDIRPITHSMALRVLEPGKLVICYAPEKRYHMILSLGDNRFAGWNNHQFNNKLGEKDNIISARQLGLFNKGLLQQQGLCYRVLSGEVNVEKTRVAALLGSDSRIAFTHNTSVPGGSVQMQLKAHGAPTNINYYDTLECAEVVLGINELHNQGRPLKELELISCYGGYGGAHSCAQVLANRLQIPVKSYRRVVVDHKFQRQGSALEFSPQNTFGARRLHESVVWHLHLHNLLERLYLRWHHLVSSRRPRSEPIDMSFTLITMNILRLLNGMLDSDSFLERYPGVTTPKLIKEALTLLGADAASDGLLGAILTLLYGERKMQCALQQFLVENDHDRLRHTDPPLSRPCHAK